MPITSKITLPLCRPREPSFVPKLNCRFDLPADHLSGRYKDIGVEVLEQYNDESIQKLPVKTIEYPDLKFIKTFDKNSYFSIFNSNHMKYATALMKIFDEAKDVDELISLAVYCRDQVNKELFVYSYYTVLIHREDTQDFELPQIFEIHPHTFFGRNSLTQLHAAAYESKSQKRTTREANKNEPVTIDYPFRGRMSASNSEEKLKFFREDVGINSHHYHWHAVYPFEGPSPKYYNKDRRGELFFFMHHQLMNWYDCTRLALGVPRVEPFDNFRAPIEVGYFSELTTANYSAIEVPRPDNVRLQDLNRPDSTNVKLADMERWYERILEAVDKGYGVDSNGNKIDLLNDKGIDILGNTLEPHPATIDRGFYGQLHNAGHEIMGLVHDPTNKYKTQPNIMKDFASALRDPLFYQWHKMVDNLCARHKSTLPIYTQEELQFNDIKIKSLDLLDESNNSIDQLITFWQKSTVDLQNGLDFQSSNNPSRMTFTHLNYRNFTYSLRVENRNTANTEGTVRIFLLPIKDATGYDFSFDARRSLAIEIDQFRCKFPPGIIRLKRKSSESTVIIPLERVYPSHDSKILDQPEDVQNACMCGWPENLLFPKGSENGCPYQIFVMVSDYKLDKVEQTPPQGLCNDNYVLCGLRNRKYPDKRPMGFPFDRPANDDIQVIDDFLEGKDNMIYKTITIRHLDENTAQIGNDPSKIVKI